MSIDVDLAVLSTMATTLEEASDGLDGLSGSVPKNVDAGPMAPIIAAMLAQVTDSAGNVSSSLGATADAILQARQYYQRADADAEATFSEIDDVMQR
ncbi:hypothetical protein [Aeromicrobium sp. CnD17-E]|uniref:hypothetical protein n=1 Tax=unclassified Aeromicrobium TaxID=2633570 RepID=UPI002098305E|nr:hypothetical protein [Aeromicrobium sp. CnD17-E]MCO7239286.1 hypothetical protein [Aeromicrobium sp. CnD17-E]